MDNPLSRRPGQLGASLLLAALHDVFLHNQSLQKSLSLDSTSALLVDKQVPEQLLHALWRHSVIQEEDELLLLYPAHEAAQSVLAGAVASFPGIDSRVLLALSVLQPFLTAMTPTNLNQRYHNGVAMKLNLSSDGNVASARIELAEHPLINLEPLLALPKQKDWRSFDVFYHMLYSQLDDADQAEILCLKASPVQYNLLRNSDTFNLPSWVAFADDYTLAKDWADTLEEVFPKSFRRSLLMTLSGILLLGNGDQNRDDLADGAALIGLDYESASRLPTRELISATYVAVVQSVVAQLNRYLAGMDIQDQASPEIDSGSSVTIAELATCAEHRRQLLRSRFDNNFAMNAEIIEDGLTLPKPPSNVSKALSRLAREPPPPQLAIVDHYEKLLDASARWYVAGDLGKPFALEQRIEVNRVWSALSIAPSATAQVINAQEMWVSSIVSTQIRDLFVTEWVQHSKAADFTADFAADEFCTTFETILPQTIDPTHISHWASSRFEPQDFFQGHNRVYMSELAWNELEGQLHGTSQGMPLSHQTSNMTYGVQPVESMVEPPEHAAEVPQQVETALRNYEEPAYLDGDEQDEPTDEEATEELMKDYKGIENGQHLEAHIQTKERKAWVFFVWLVTFWIPSPLLQWFGRMKRRDVRLAWREKVVIFALITLLNAGIIFYMIVLGHLICPEYDKVWNHKELSYHQGTNDFYVGIFGNVYDISKFYRIQHSDNGVKTTAATMLPFAGEDITGYFPPPLTVACPSLVSDVSVKLTVNSTRYPYTEAMHTSGSYLVPNNNTALHQYTWFDKVFKPGIQQYHKGRIVETPKTIEKMVAEDPSRYLVILNKTVYDVSEYVQTIEQYPGDESRYYEKYNFFPNAVTSLFQNYQGMDITEKWKALDEKTQANSLECLNNAFVYSHMDFRHTAKCQAANVILLVIAGLLTSITVIKFLASIRFGAKPMPSPQDKFVICQVPVYTESEDEVRLAIDSLSTLKYDNRRKLMVILCDGMITGSGNDRPTPDIILDILGIDDSRLDVQPKAYHAIAEGSRELNYAKVYSGLHQYDGNSVPFVVVVKVGAPGESRPGNRGKRDSQIILMNFLSRLHHRDPMSPLDLELFYHINNVIGVDPERYEYLFTVDADTRVKPDSLTRLVAACTADNSIAAVCGETGIQNEKQSLSTMVQVYEYFISHHLTKAFESLFGSVTCLPGCFSLYRLRTHQRSRPLFISPDVIREYSLRHVDTLHKKNLFSLGEDRYLTTLMSKHFSRMKMKFVADAKCETRVPNEFSVLLSQRRRWINSTVHNLAELLRLETMCGFCLLSMRGIVFTDLVGTLMLPSVVVYLVYLIYVLASHSSPLPLISIILIAAVYGLQALVFIMHRRWQHIFWMIVYIAAYPFHSFILPIYSFWNMDDFGWGNTRIVVNETKGKKIVLQDDLDKFDPKSVPFEPWESYALRNGIPGAERSIIFDSRKGRVERTLYEDPAIYEAWMERNANETMRFSSQDTEQPPRPGSVYSGQMRRPLSMNTLSGVLSGPNGQFDAGTEAQIRSTIQQVLNSTDLDTMTSRQLREKVGDLLGTEFVGERAYIVDSMIDDELERMDEAELIGHPTESFEMEDSLGSADYAPDMSR